MNSGTTITGLRFFEIEMEGMPIFYATARDHDDALENFATAKGWDNFEDVEDAYGSGFYTAHEV